MATAPYQIPPIDRSYADFSQSKYSVSSTMYPDDLMSGDYGGNYVVFNINVNVDSKLLKTSAVGLETVDNVPGRIRGYVEGGVNAKDAQRSTLAMIGSSQAETYLTALTGGIALNQASSFLRMTGEAAKALTRTIAGAASLGSASLGALKAAGSTTNTRAQKRLKVAIALGMPEDVSVNYSTNWESAEMANPMIANKLGDNLRGSFESLIGMKGSPIEGSGLGKSIGAAFASVGLRSFGGMNFASAATGVAANPMKEQVFEGANMRDFSFTYTFFPRTKVESNNIQRIIYLFKYHMLPEFLDADKFLFVYPSEFDITYYKDGKVNTNLFRHTSCILKSMDVDYTPNQQFNTFNDGSPIAIKVKLDFTELLPMTKELVEIGA